MLNEAKIKIEGASKLSEPQVIEEDPNPAH